MTRSAPTANPTNSVSQTFAYSGAEPGGTFQCKLDAASYAACPGSPVTITGLSEGSHSYSVVQSDALGNLGAPTTLTWFVDTTAPAAPTVTRSNPIATPTNATSQVISYGGLEAGATAQCKLDSAAAAPCAASPITLSALSGGTHTFSITQTDSSGNISPAGTVTWTVDITAPNAPTVTRTAPQGNPTPLSTQTIAYSGAEAGGTFQCKLDSASFGACPSSPISISGLADGAHSYSITQTDDAGNIGSAATVTWTVDSSSPITPNVTRTAPTADPTNSLLANDRLQR